MPISTREFLAYVRCCPLKLIQCCSFRLFKKLIKYDKAFEQSENAWKGGGYEETHRIHQRNAQGGVTKKCVRVDRETHNKGGGRRNAQGIWRNAQGANNIFYFRMSQLRR